MTPEEMLELARSGELARLGEQRNAVGAAVSELAAAGDAASALELVARAWRIWLLSGELEAGGAAARTALEAPGAEAVPLWRGRVLYADGVFAFRAGDQEHSEARSEEALRLAREAGDVLGECDALTGLARIALRRGDYAEVVTLAREGRDRAQAVGDRDAETAPLHLHAAGVRLQGDYARARELYLESLRLNEELGNEGWVGMEHHNLGWVELHLGDVEAAESHFTASETASAGDAYGEAWRELNRAALAAARGSFEDARRRFDAATAALEQAGIVPDPDDGSELDWLRRLLDERR